jgi:hypothetical protein
MSKTWAIIVLMWLNFLSSPLRVLLFSPKLIARMWGRLQGVLA